MSGRSPRELLRDLLRGGDHRELQYASRHAEAAALASVMVARLLANKFASPQDVRIRQFVASTWAGFTPAGLSAKSAERVIRGTLSQDLRSAGPMPSADQTVALQVFLLGVLVADAELTAEQLELLFDSSEPVAQRLLQDGPTRDADTSSAPAEPGKTGWRDRRVLAAVGSVVTLMLAVVLIGAMLGGRDSASDELTTGPAKPESFLEVYPTEYPVGLRGRTLAESDGMFVGPHFALRILQVDITDSVDFAIADSLGEDQAFTAAEGHELVLFNVADDPALEAPWGEGQVEAALVVDGAERPLDSLPAFRETVVASVREEAPVLLQVTDSDRQLQFDLRSGRVVSGEGSYISSSGSLPTMLYQTSAEVAYGSRLQQLRVELLSMGGTINLEPYHPDFGWAKPGRAWLTVGPFIGRSTPSEYDPTFGYFDVAFDLDVRESLRLEVPGAGPLSPVRTWPRHAKLHEPTSPSEIVALFDVPASFREGQLVITPRGAMAVDTSSLTSAFGVRPHRDCGKPDVACVPWSEPPPAGTVELGVSQ